MSIRDEVELLMREAKGPLTAEVGVERAKNKKRYPALHEHIWGTSEKELAQEARLARMHQLLIRIQITTAEGKTTRLYVHTRGVPGYQPLQHVVSNYNLAATKLAQLREDIGRARARLSGFAAALPGDVATEIDDALAVAESKATLQVEKAA